MHQYLTRHLKLIFFYFVYILFLNTCEIKKKLSYYETGEYLKGVKKLKCFIIMIYLPYNKGQIHVEVYMGMGISYFSTNLLVEPQRLDNCFSTSRMS